MPTLWKRTIKLPTKLDRRWHHIKMNPCRWLSLSVFWTLSPS
jgi:hypothetical protein